MTSAVVANDGRLKDNIVDDVHHKSFCLQELFVLKMTQLVQALTSKHTPTFTV
jgi:hypothetical protein